MQSNYELMSVQMRSEFLKYDQDRMIEKLDLRHDDEFLYIRFCGREYSVNRNTGEVLGSPDGSRYTEHADYNEVMSIYDVLCHSKDSCHLSGKFMPVYSLKGVVQSANPGSNFFEDYAKMFSGRITELETACRNMGGVPDEKGDVCYRLPVFDFLPLILRFYDQDDEFPASMSLLWDENVLDYLHFETTFFAAGNLLKRLSENVRRST